MTRIFLGTVLTKKSDTKVFFVARTVYFWFQNATVWPSFPLRLVNTWARRGSGLWSPTPRPIFQIPLLAHFLWPPHLESPAKQGENRRKSSKMYSLQNCLSPLAAYFSWSVAPIFFGFYYTFLLLLFLSSFENDLRAKNRHFLLFGITVMEMR